MTRAGNTTPTATSTIGGPKPTPRPSRPAPKRSWTNTPPTRPLPGVHVNGRLTLGENLADLGGVSIAYEALERALAKDPSKRRKIDGFTPEQRFFISFAQIWRTNCREAEMVRLITVDVHSPGQFRAIGAAREHAGVLRRLRHQARRPHVARRPNSARKSGDAASPPPP